MRSTRRTVATTRRVAMRSTSRSRGLASGRGRAQRRPPPLRLLRRHLDRPLGRPLPLPSAPPTAPPSGPRLGPPSGPTYTGSIPLGRLPPPPTDLTSAHALPPHSSLYGLGATPNAMQGWHGCQWAVASMGGLLPAGRASMAQQRPLHPGVPHGLFASSAADSRQAVLAQYLQSQAVAAQRQGAPSSLPRQGGLPASGRANQQPLSAPAIAPAALPMAAAPPPSAHRASGQGSVTAKELD